MINVRRLRARFAAALSLAVCVLVGNTPCVAAETAPNTTISNTSSATYDDSLSNVYSANSNTVSIVVQNAPSLTIAPGTNQTIAPGQTVTDTFLVTNTGNAAGTVQLTAAATIGGSDSGSTTVTYSYGGTGYATYTTLNTALNSVSVPVNGSISVSVVYALASTATAPGTVTTAITGTIAYVAVGSAPAETSSAVTATAETDTVTADARLDLQLTSAQNGGTGAITYTLVAANGTGTWAAKDSTAVQDLLGTGTAGVFISTKIPQFPAGTPLTVTGTATTATSATNGFPASGATAAIYYTNSTTGASGWTLASGGTIPAGAFYIGVFVTGGSCTVNGSTMTHVEVCPVATPTSSAGNVPNAAITLTYAVTQSAASGSANSGSTTAIGNSLIGDNAATEHVIGPGITLNSLADGNDTATITTAGEGVNNTTSENSPSGASQITSNQSLAAYLVMNGPFGNPSATGAYDGSSNDTTHDFTAVSFLKVADKYTTTNTTASYTPTTSSTTSAAVTGINVESTLANTGNHDDTYTVLATAPSTWTVQLFADNAGSPGTALGGATSGATSTASAVAIASGATLNYWAVYAAPTGVAYLSHGVATVLATSVGNTAVSNQTNHLLYAGFVAITTTATTTTGCPAVTPTIVVGTVCPGGTINYTIDYRNIVATTDVSSVPAVSFARVSTKAGTLVITADGTNQTVGTNNWATYTGGPTVAPTDTTAATTFAYYTGATGGTSVGSTFQTGLTKFVATTGGATFQLVPSGYGSGTAQGTITFAVVVK